MPLNEIPHENFLRTPLLTVAMIFSCFLRLRAGVQI